jgi:hypothetical protein
MLPGWQKRLNNVPDADEGLGTSFQKLESTHAHGRALALDFFFARLNLQCSHHPSPAGSWIITQIKHWQTVP